jgi:hypothetical protein
MDERSNDLGLAAAVAEFGMMNQSIETYFEKAVGSVPKSGEQIVFI